MGTFFMFGRYSLGTTEKISPERAAVVHEEVERLGGRVQNIYALLGEYDVVIIADLPRMGEAMQAAFALKQRTGISLFTSAAMSIEEFAHLTSP
jgi:uncharacterized protein with GYD domain